MNGISTFLWFDGAAEEAADHYVSIFPNSSIDSVSRQGAEADGVPAPVLMVSFQLDGRPFVALNGGPMFSFTPAISFVVSCEGQAEGGQGEGACAHRVVLLAVRAPATRCRQQGLGGCGQAVYSRRVIIPASPWRRRRAAPAAPGGG